MGKDYSLPQTQYTKSSAKFCVYYTENVFDLLHSHDQHLTLDGLVEIRQQSAIWTRLSLSLSRGPWRFQSSLEGQGSLKLASRCLGTLIGTSSEQQRLDRELSGCLLDMRRSWRTRRRLCLARVQRLISSSHLQGLVHRHLHCWTLEMMI
jgi:hypothetical protein